MAGLLTAEEFETEKAELLDRMWPSPHTSPSAASGACPVRYAGRKLMNVSTRRRRVLLLVLSVCTSVVVAAVIIPPVRDLLAFVVAFALLGIFVVIRLVAAPLAESSDRPWDLWGGMGTHDELWSGQLPAQPPGREPLPDAEPIIDGHPPGQRQGDPP